MVKNTMYIFTCQNIFIRRNPLR